ncbi:hypothetical protein Bca101_039459 [Brassica carinata]
MALNVIEKVQVSPATRSSDDSVNSFTVKGADARREACWVLREYEDSERWTRDHCMDSNHTAGASRDANRPHSLHVWSRNVQNGLDPWRLVCSLVMAQEKLGRQSWLLLNIKETTWLQLPSIIRDIPLSHTSKAQALSLSQVLRYYLPLTGRLTWSPQDTKPCVTVSKHDTVSLTVAETDADFSFLSGDGLRPATDHRPLVPELKIFDDSATLLSVQVTLFPKQGFCMGIASHHSVNDGATSEMFIKSWDHICRLQQHTINVPSGLESKMVEFVSSGDKFKTLKPTPSELSPDVVHPARAATEQSNLWLTNPTNRLLARAAVTENPQRIYPVRNRWQLQTSPREKVLCPRVCLRVDLCGESAWRLPEQKQYVLGWFQYEARAFLKDDGFVKAVEILSDSVKGLASQGIESLFEDYVEGTKKIKPGEQFGSVAGLTRLGINGTDFGWGRPVKTEFVSIDRSGSFSMLGRRDGQVVVWRLECA